MFITIACGALSGFHALIASGTTPKMIEKETQVRFIGYGAMLMESFVAVMALIAASIIDPGLYYAMNAPAARRRRRRCRSASRGRQRPRLRDHARTRSRRAARAVEEETLVARTGGAPTLAIGMSTIFAGATGEGLRAFWYHFAIMFEALFILTTVDAGTRVGRFMLQDTLGNVYKPFRDVSWKPGVWFCSAVIVGAWGYFLYAGVTNPLGGINQLFPLFGIANQLLAAVALTVCTTLLIKAGKLKWAWVTGIPLAWDAAVTLTASYQKVFSSDPKLGFFAQRDKFQDAIDAGEVLPPAKTMDDMHAVVTNSTVDGILAAFFAILIIIVIARRHPHLHQGHPLARAAADHRGAGRGVAAGRAVRAVRARRGAELGGARVTVKRAFSGVRWYLREVSGESAYDRYVEHRRREHPGEPVMSRRDFERRRQDAREARPQARCC